VSFETDDIAGTRMRDGYMYAGVVKQRGTRRRANAQCGIIAISHEAAAIKTGRCFATPAIMRTQMLAGLTQQLIDGHQIRIVFTYQRVGLCVQAVANEYDG